MKYILALDFQDFIGKCNELRLDARREAVFINEPHKLRGVELSPSDVIITDRAKDRRDYQYGMEMIKSRCRLP
jgi:hypothetical protein